MEGRHGYLETGAQTAAVKNGVDRTDIELPAVQRGLLQDLKSLDYKF